jgi:hypothetical protein
MREIHPEIPLRSGCSHDELQLVRSSAARLGPSATFRQCCWASYQLLHAPPKADCRTADIGKNPLLVRSFGEALCPTVSSEVSSGSRSTRTSRPHLGSSNMAAGRNAAVQKTHGSTSISSRKACMRCNSQKRRCDKTFPTCGLCKRCATAGP